MIWNKSLKRDFFIAQQSYYYYKKRIYLKAQKHFVFWGAAENFEKPDFIY